MAISFYTNNVKKQCPYLEKCYRKNPIHFNEMGHPHLEKIVLNQLEGDIQIPEKLEFDCSDRSLLVDQLKVLQMVLRKERNKNQCSSSTKDFSSKISSTSSKVANEISDQRKNLKDTDKEAEAHYKCSNEKGNQDLKKISKMKEELDNLKIIEEATEKNFSQERKRDNSGFDDNKREKKKSKSSHSKSSEVKEHTESSSSLKGTSFIDSFQLCKSVKSRNEVRDRAIKAMKQQGLEVSVVEPGNFAIKYALSAPYYLFFSRVEKTKETYDQMFSITFPEILDISLGEIVNSFHINFMVDIGWLCLQYLLAGQSTDMMILYGERIDGEKLNSNITAIPISMPTTFGCHHSKLMILKYKDDGIRVVVSTANLYSDDWENRTQGVWISPHLPQLPESANSSEGKSPTGFKKDLRRYLERYREPMIAEWGSILRRADFSSVNVFFLASIPGRHTGMELDLWGHRKLGSVLSKYAKLPPDAPQWTLIAQSSSIGSLGPNYESWLQKDIVSSMSKENPTSLKSLPNFQFIYPSINNYKQSFDCQVGSCCLPYSLRTHFKQEWIKSYMYQWKAAVTGRDKAMPHIKTYMRVSPDLKKIPWFVLTSANLSKAAWGNSGKDNLYILNFEAGVIFIPQFVIGSSTFPIKEEEAGVAIFPIPYDLPLTKYEDEDKPFVTEFYRT